jgi:hypothetical protein
MMRAFIGLAVVAALFVAMLLAGIPLEVAVPLTAVSVAIGLFVGHGPQWRRGQP